MTTREQTFQTLLDQATTPLQTFILMGQLTLLRQQERLRSQAGALSAEAMLTIFMVLLVLLGTFGIGISAAALADHIDVETAIRVVTPVQ